MGEVEWVRVGGVWEKGRVQEGRLMFNAGKYRVFCKEQGQEVYLWGFIIRGV